MCIFNKTLDIMRTISARQPFIWLLMLLSALQAASGQEGGLPIPPGLQQAYELGTRSPDGRPGENYWQNRADYDLRVQFDPVSRKIAGTGTVTYFNNSPDTLDYLLLMLLPDLYREGNPRDFRVARNDEHPGTLIRELRINGRPIHAERGGREMLYGATSAWLRLPEAMPARSSLSMDITWEYTLNKGSHMRTGQVGNGSFFVAYWFPRIGVYDDVSGWNDYLYSGVGEFYNDFGDFDVEITVPANFVVWATGELQNPEAVLAGPILERYRAARQSREVIPIIGEEDLDGPLTQDDPFIAWSYSAANVTDFAFALSDRYRWDGLTMPAGPDGAPVFISAAYDPASDDFHQVAYLAGQAIGYMTTRLPGLPFPYPAITVFNGLDEMEYPMMVNNISNRDLAETFKLTAHEVCHSYFPFLTGCNERKYAWMDEGLTSYFDYLLTRDLGDGGAYVYFTDLYLAIRGSEADLPLITSSDIIRAPDYYALSYAKAAFFYAVLRDEVGKEAFREIIGEFTSRWSGRHPTGYDLIRTFSDSYGEDLTWLFRPWFNEFGMPDLGIGKVERTEDGYSVTVSNAGSLPAPVRLLATFPDGTTTLFTRPPGTWKEGCTSVDIEIAAPGGLKQLELVQELPMDNNPANDIYRIRE